MNRKLSVFAAFLFAVSAAVAAPQDTWGQTSQGSAGGVPPCYLPNYDGTLPCQATSPAALLQQAIASMRRFQTSGATFVSPAGMRFLEKNIAPYFDFAYMTDIALRVGSNRISGSDRARAITILRHDVLGHMASNVADYEATRVEVGAAFRGARGEVAVPMRVWQRRTGQLVGLEFHFHFAYGQWRIYNIMVGGRSALIHYQSALPHLMLRP